MVREQTLSANEKKSYWRIFNGWSFINACSVILKELYARSPGIGGGVHGASVFNWRRSIASS